MIRNLLVGAALGFIGKKLYDNGTLDPYIVRAKGALDEFQASNAKATPAEPNSSPA